MKIKVTGDNGERLTEESALNGDLKSRQDPYTQTEPGKSVLGKEANFRSLHRWKSCTFGTAPILAVASNV